MSWWIVLFSNTNLIVFDDNPSQRWKTKVVMWPLLQFKTLHTIVEQSHALSLSTGLLCRKLSMWPLFTCPWLCHLEQANITVVEHGYKHFKYQLCCFSCWHSSLGYLKMQNWDKSYYTFVTTKVFWITILLKQKLQAWIRRKIY
jgi:hypothetical protein